MLGLVPYCPEIPYYVLSEVFACLNNACTFCEQADVTTRQPKLKEVNEKVTSYLHKTTKESKTVALNVVQRC